MDKLLEFWRIDVTVGIYLDPKTMSSNCPKCLHVAYEAMS